MPYKSYKFHKEIHDAFQRAGIQCDLKIVKQSNLTDPHFIISCALYQKNRKAVMSYVSDFISTLRAYKSHSFKNYIIRIYYDKSAAEHIAPITRAATGLNLELIEYLFRGFQREGKHMEHFGALIRYMPLFNTAHNCAINCILDIDTYMSIDTIIDKIADMDEKNCGIYGYVLDSIYFDEQRYLCGAATQTVPPLLGGCLIIKREICPPIDVLISFLKSTTAPSKWATFKYGTDENFLNCRWLRAVGKCRIMYDIYYLYVAKLFYYIVAVPFDTYSGDQKKYILDAARTILNIEADTATEANDREILKSIDKITYYHTATKKNDLYKYLRANAATLRSIYEMLDKMLKSALFKNVSIPREYRAAIADNINRPTVLDWPPKLK